MNTNRKPWKRPRMVKGQPQPSARTRAFKVRFRKIGEKDGPTFQGQTRVKPCATCGGQAARKVQN